MKNYIIVSLFAVIVVLIFINTIEDVENEKKYKQTEINLNEQIDICESINSELEDQIKFLNKIIK